MELSASWLLPVLAHWCAPRIDIEHEFNVVDESRF